MKIIFTLFLSLLAVSAFSQQNFVPGYYTTHEGEKVEVQINDRNWEKNPKFIDIQPKSGGKVQLLNVTDVQGFGLSTGDVYEAHIVDVDKSPTKLGDIQPNSEPIIVRDTVFLRAIVKGPVSLYYLKDENAKKHYYIKKGDEVPIELILRTIRFKGTDKSGYTKSPMYRDTLVTQLTDCPDISSDRIEHLSFSEKSFKKLISDYNLCISGSKGDYLAPEEKVKWGLDLVAGVSYSNLSISTDKKELAEPTFAGANYTGGLSLLATLPRLRNKWGVKSELLFKPLNYENIYEEGVDDGKKNYIKASTTFDIAYAGVNMLLQYKFLNSRIKPYVAVGVANNFLLSDKSHQTVFRRYYTIESTKEQKPLESVRKHEQAVLFGIGAALGRVSAELRFEMDNGFSPYMDIGITKRTALFHLSYSLF